MGNWVRFTPGRRRCSSGSRAASRSRSASGHRAPPGRAVRRGRVHGPRARPGARVLRHGAAPSVPAEYARALDGVAIGPEVGSCGAAAFRGSTWRSEDIATHPYWEKYRALAPSTAPRVLVVTDPRRGGWRARDLRALRVDPASADGRRAGLGRGRDAPRVHRASLRARRERAEASEGEAAAPPRPRLRRLEPRQPGARRPAGPGGALRVGVQDPRRRRPRVARLVRDVRRRRGVLAGGSRGP